VKNTMGDIVRKFETLAAFLGTPLQSILSGQVTAEIDCTYEYLEEAYTEAVDAIVRLDETTAQLQVVIEQIPQLREALARHVSDVAEHGPLSTPREETTPLTCAWCGGQVIIAPRSNPAAGIE
jgi:hypothetical protein